jgi:hypothetical protein
MKDRLESRSCDDSRCYGGNEIENEIKKRLPRRKWETVVAGPR